MSTDINPPLGHGLLFTQTGVGASPGYDMIDLRRFLSVGRQEGPVSSGSYKVSQRGAGANMSVDIAASTGDGCLVQGDSVTGQGLYFVPAHTAVINEAITAAHATLPRLDQVILEVLDDTHAGGGNNKSRVRVADGTATSGATLDNRSGAAALPVSALRLADVLVGAADSAITDAEIRDKRPGDPSGPPTGTVSAYAGSISPTGYLLCDGSAVSRATESRLFAAIGTVYGVGDGTTTFNLPDLRGRVPVGVDDTAGRLDANDALGNTAGAQKHTLSEAEVKIPSDVIRSNAGGAAILGDGGINQFTNVRTHGIPATTAHNNMQPYQVVNYLIKT